MDRRDFYKQLMSQYTFDEDKIRRNAKRARYPGTGVLSSKWLPLASAAAVFVTVFCGYMFLIAKDEPPVNPSEFSSTITPEQRIIDMEQRVLVRVNQDQQIETADMYISFKEPMSFSEIEFTMGLLSDTGEVEIAKFYDYNWGKFVDETQISDGRLYSAVKISAPTDLLPDIKDLSSAVVYVELASESINDDSFTPITKKDVEDVEKMSTTTAPITPPPQTQAAVETSQQIETAPPDDSQTQTQSQSQTQDSSLDEEEELPELTESQENSSIEITLLSLNIQGALSAQFINNDHFLVLTEQSVELYRIMTEPQRDFELITSLSAKNPKIISTNFDESVFIITGEDIYDVRNTLFVANGIDQTLVAIDLKLYDASIAYSYYQNGFILTKAKSYDYESFYYSQPNGYGGYDSSRLCDFEIQAALLNIDGNRFIYALADDSETKLFEYNIATSKVTPLEFSTKGRAVFARSADLTNFAVLTRKETWVYNAVTGSFIDCQKGTKLEFSKSDSRYFKFDGEYYLIEENSLVSTDHMPLDDSASINSNLYSLFSLSETDIKFEVK